MRPALEEKNLLNPGETIKLFRLSQRKFYDLINGKRKLPFLVLYNKRKLIIRTEFERYLKANPDKEEELQNGLRKPHDQATRLEASSSEIRGECPGGRQVPIQVYGERETEIRLQLEAGADGQITPRETTLSFPARIGKADRIRPGIADRPDEEEYDRYGTGGEVPFHEDRNAAQYGHQLQIRQKPADERGIQPVEDW